MACPRLVRLSVSLEVTLHFLISQYRNIAAEDASAQHRCPSRDIRQPCKTRPPLTTTTRQHGHLSSLHGNTNVRCSPLAITNRTSHTAGTVYHGCDGMADFDILLQQTSCQAYTGRHRQRREAHPQLCHHEARQQRGKGRASHTNSSRCEKEECREGVRLQTQDQRLWR